MNTSTNWFGLAGSTTVLLTVVVSLFVPWWQLVAGDSLVNANVSPIYTNFNLIGTSFTIPILFALNISTIILLTTGGIAVLVCSLRPMASYAEKLMSFGYRKPLYSLILFTAGLIAVTLIVKAVLGLDIPLIGSTRVTLPTSLTQGVTVIVPLAAGFQWPFVLAIAGATLCIAAKLTHSRFVPIQEAPNENILTAIPVSPVA